MVRFRVPRRDVCQLYCIGTHEGAALTTYRELGKIQKGQTNDSALNRTSRPLKNIPFYTVVAEKSCHGDQKTSRQAAQGKMQKIYTISETYESGEEKASRINLIFSRELIVHFLSRARRLEAHRIDEVGKHKKYIRIVNY